MNSASSASFRITAPLRADEVLLAAAPADPDAWLAKAALKMKPPAYAEALSCLD